MRVLASLECNLRVANRVAKHRARTSGSILISMYSLHVNCVNFQSRRLVTCNTAVFRRPMLQMLSTGFTMFSIGLSM